VKNYIILTLADGGKDSGSPAYKKYFDLMNKTSQIVASYYNNDLEQIKDDNKKDNVYVLGLKSEIMEIYILREDSGGGGFRFGNQSDRTTKINDVIKRLCEIPAEDAKINTENEIIVIAHHEVDESKLSNYQVITYRTGGDFNTNPEWGVVCYIVDNCLLKYELPVFKEVKNRINYCKVIRPLRIKIHELELLIAPLKIESYGETSVNDNDIKECFREIKSLILDDEDKKDSIEQLLKLGGYIKDGKISSAIERLKEIIQTDSHKTENLDLRFLCNELLKNLKIISEKIFFSTT